MSVQTDTLFKPGQAGAIPVANRVLMAPMTRNRAARAGVPGRWRSTTTASAPAPA